MRALVRPPTPSLADGIVTHIERTPVDFPLAATQWESYNAALVDAGWELVEVTHDDSCPDAVFIEDAAVMFGGVAVACRPGAASRRAEVSPVVDALTDLGFAVRALSAESTLDGGDVMKVGTTAYVGVGGRTNERAITELQEILGPGGWTVVPVPLSRVLHLKSAVTALPDGRVIGWADGLDDTSVFAPTGGFVAMPEERGAHVIEIATNTLLIAAGCDASEELLASFGYACVAVDIGEFEKLEGCVTCLSIRVR